MKQKEKQLLLIDLCARLSYGVLFMVPDINEPVELLSINPKRDKPLEIDDGHDENSSTYWNLEDVTPYLRPMASMTEEEKEDILQALNIHGDIDTEGNLLLGVEYNILTLKVCKKYLGELNKRMFDVCHLIEKGLALEAPEGMYNIK